MFPLLALAALAGVAGYQYSKHKHKKSDNTNNTTASTNTDTDVSSTAKNVKHLQLITQNESENGNTLFGSQKKTKKNNNKTSKICYSKLNIIYLKGFLDL